MASDKDDKSDYGLGTDSAMSTGESNQDVPGKESRSVFFASSFKVDESNSGLGTCSSTDISKGNQKVPGKQSRSSSSSSRSSSSDDSKLTQSDLSRIEDDVPVSSMPSHDDNHSHDHGPMTNHHDGSMAQLPPSPITGQPTDPKPSGSYRIPSSVFARTKSCAPEWSVASNESLFSIHGENMSFTGDSGIWYAKSGEYHYDSSTFGLSPDMSSDIPPSAQKSNSSSTEMAQIISTDNGSPDVAEPKAHGVLTKDISDVKGKQSVDRPSFGDQQSDASMSSVKSFAFPILTNDNKHQSAVQPQNPVGAESKESSQESPKQVISPKSAPAADQGKWSCFPCARFCS